MQLIQPQPHAPLHDIVRAQIVALVTDVAQDLDNRYDGEVTSDTRLVQELGFSSVDIISLVVAIEEHFQRRNLGFADLLMKDGRYVDDLSVDALATFVTARLGGEPS
jgi:acyl carrier protein